MLRAEKPLIKYRKDYSQAGFAVESVSLNIDLNEDVTTVISTLLIKRENADLDSLKLDGHAQKIVSIKLNQQLLTDDDFELNDENLTIKKMSDEFTLEIITEIQPQQNKALMGLYKSAGNYCTQCESEGFRGITYYPDRPDVLSIFTTTITADKEKYPVLLANGNLTDSGDLDNGRHFATWHDPFKKPCYLFAMVAGDLGFVEDEFTTMSDRKVTLKVFAAHDKIEQCHFAMQALKKAMRWDEETYGREYDLDIFMIVAVNDFNFGAMENKGLNIFNDKYILASPQTATDADYSGIDAVVAHEYFHNWSGDRVTVRDWFQLSLKEGFTVFRDHSFSQDVGLNEVVRINEVKTLRRLQFPEDAGPLSHPIRPDSYIEMSNFYTTTVYEKGSEVIRMMKTLVGKDGFRKGTDLYFDRHDGCAVTCEDFVKAIEDANDIDLQQFRLWYSQAGTPEVSVSSHYDNDKKIYQLTLKQVIPATPGQTDKRAMHIPVKIALFDTQGKKVLDDQVLQLKQAEQTFTFENIAADVVPSLLRGFSAPIKLDYNYNDADLSLLIANDDDGFARFEAMQHYACNVIFKLMQDDQQGDTLQLSDEFTAIFASILKGCQQHPALAAQMLTLPSEAYLAELMDVVDVKAIHTIRSFIKKQLANKLSDEVHNLYKDLLTTEAYAYDVDQVAKRSLKNVLLSYIAAENTKATIALCFEQFESANNMTDQMAAFSVLSHIDCNERVKVIDDFFAQWQNNALVMDKWFAVQAMADLPNMMDRTRTLLKHPLFDIENPNKARSVLLSFSKMNPVHFHCKEGYELLTDYVLRIDAMNPMVAARLLSALTTWRRHSDDLQILMKQCLQKIVAHPGLSKDVYEIASKSLA